VKLNHKFVVPAAIDVVWAAFNDVEGLVPCVPGATLVSSNGDSFEGTIKVKLGPISMVYGGTATFLERDEAAGRMVVEAKGKDKRGNGTAGATVVAQITSEGTGTVVEVSTDLSVTGKPAQFGRGVIQDVSDKLLGQFVDCISAKLGPNGTADAAPVSDKAGDSAIEREVDVAGQYDIAGKTDAAASAATATTSASPPIASTAKPASKPTGAPGAKPAEVNLLSTVLPVLVRRYRVPIIVGLALVVGVWIGRAAR
jgi:uncharacterized protein